MSITAMKQALEALENSVDLTEGEYTEAVRMYGHYPTRKGKLDGLKAFADAHQAAITALRQAIEQAETPTYTTGHCKEKAKPGGCQLHNLQCGYPACDRKEVVQAQKSFAEAHPANPDAKCKCEHWQSCAECHPTAHPPTAPAQPLTDKQIDLAIETWFCLTTEYNSSHKTRMRNAIEAATNIKGASL